MSPRKKPKLKGIKTEYNSINDCGDFETDHTLEEAMPGFYDHEDDDEHDDDSDLADPQLLPDPPEFQLSRSRPISHSRVSDIVKTSTSSASNARFAAKPRSMSAVVQPSSSTSGLVPAQNSISGSLTCPVCEKALLTDNEGLNSHIDFCLSRGAIRQAHAEASSPVKKSKETKDQIAGIQLTAKRCIS